MNGINCLCEVRVTAVKRKKRVEELS